MGFYQAGGHHPATSGTSGLACKHGEVGAKQTCGQDVVKKVKMAATVEQSELLAFLTDVTLNMRDGLLLASLWPPS